VFGVFGVFFGYTLYMTTIIGIQHENSCLIAADSRTTNEYGRPYHDKRVAKITERGAWIIAGAGDPQACDIIQHIWQPPKQEIKDDYKFMVTKVTLSIRDCLKKNGYERDKDDKDGGFIFLLAYKGKLYEIDECFTVYLNEEGFYGLGSGSRWALGALQAGASWEKALEIAEKNDVYTGRPFISLTQAL
jgi:ATP-dependent protease HslVU (ClpYQ) peptidase subunit